MPELNKANRQTCDVDIRILKTMAPFLKFDTANTTTAGLTGDSAYAMAKGSRRIAFQNPMEGTMTIEAQVYPFKLFSLFSDGQVESSAVYAATQKVTAAANGTLTLVAPNNSTIEAGSVFVYPEGMIGDETALILGTYADGTFTATTASQIVSGSTYEVGYMVNRTSGVKRVSFSNRKLPQDYFITMQTLDKDEEGLLTPFLMTAYKASIQRNFELSFSSEGDPATVTLTFDIMEDKDGNMFDMVELTDDAAAEFAGGGMSTSEGSIRLVQGSHAPDIRVLGAHGAVTAAITDSTGSAYTKVQAVISGDNDTVIIHADSDAAAADYTVTLTDSTSPTAQTTQIRVTVVAA